MWGSSIEVIEGDTRSLDYGSYDRINPCLVSGCQQSGVGFVCWCLRPCGMCTRCVGASLTTVPPIASFL